MATRVEIKGDRISFLRIMVGFLPLAFGYFLSVLFQRTDPLVADDLMTDLAIGKGTLGMLTAAFPLAFAVCLLPSGIAIDRFGPRAVQSVMMGVTALGALIVSVSSGPFGLMIGRALLGAGAAAALLAAMKAVVTWFPRERLGLVTGSLITIAGLVALAMAGPLFAYANGWRALFMLLAALAVLGAILTVLLVPKRATVTGDVPDQDHGLTFVLRDPVFRRFAPLAAIAVGTVWVTQGQWVAAWFAAVNGVRLTDIITYITLIAVGQTAGALVLGALADWAARKGSSAASVFVGAVALGICIQFAAVIGLALPNSIVWGALVAGAAAMLPFVILLTHFPQAYAARACASIGVLQYVATLFIQSAIGGVVAIWPQAASGQTSATAYAIAFMVPIGLQLAALVWFLLPRAETRDGAQSVGEVAAFERQMQGLSEPPPIPAGLPPDAAAAPAESAVEPADTAVEPTGTAPESTETSGETEVAAAPSAETVEAPTDIAAEPPAADTAAEPAEPEVAPVDTALASTETADETEVDDSASAEAEESLTEAPVEPASVTAEPPDAAATPADTVAEPTDTEVEHIDTTLAPTESADDAAVAASAPAEAGEALADIPPASASLATSVADTARAPAETAAALTDAALRSILDAPLSLGPRGAIDTASRASAATSDEPTPDRSAEIAQPQALELSFPLVAPSHVQALNAVYRRRPALAATIGGRQTGITAAWPPPDRRPDASHRVTLRLDSEPGELWLPQSLLDILVGSVDPALSLDRLGPDRAAIILEFALDSALAAVELNLGCRLGVDSYSGQVERLESDGLVPLFFTLVIEGLATTGCELRIPPDYALRLAEGLDRHAGISRSVLDLPIPVCLRVAAANLAAGEIERLSPDDVVLVDASCEPSDAVIAVIGERLVAPVALGPEGPHLATYPIPGATSSWAWSMPTDAVAAAWEAGAESDNRALHVLFEIGRFELPASQVKQLAPNFLLPLEPPLDQTVDIVVDGQRIGRGTVMRIGNRTGVRIIAVRERPGAAAGLKRAPAGEGTGIQ
jgi:type III secretion system YscQ/HrcQ family protein